MERERIEEFTQGGKNFIYIDLSDLKENEDFLELVKVIEPAIEKYPENSLYTVTNIENIRIDTETKKFILRYVEHNKPYVKYGVIIGLDGIKKHIINAVLSLSGRSNLFFAYSKEHAIELLLQKD